MTANSPTSIPCAWLKPFPEGYKIPVWRWFVVPASALMLRRNGGVWVSGQLTLADDGLVFTQTRAINLSKAPVESWTIPLPTISDISLSQRFASDTLALTHGDFTTRIMTVRATDFIARLRQAVASAAELSEHSEAP